MTDFVDWLTAEMARLNIGNNELARRMGSSNAQASDMLTRKRMPNYNFCMGVARALQYQPEIVLRKAGLLPEASEGGESATIMEIRALLASFSPSLQELALALLRDLKAFDEREGTASPPTNEF